jgi:microcompartment protein CcmK/EutM
MLSSLVDQVIQIQKTPVLMAAKMVFVKRVEVEADKHQEKQIASWVKQ